MPDRGRAGLTRPGLWNAALVLGLVGFALWAIVTTGLDVLAVGASTLRALWLLPGLIALHLAQLLMSARAWQHLVIPAPGLPRLYRLRIVRESIDSLLPVAQVGGEIVGARLLARNGVMLASALASVIVDVTIEFVTQLLFLLGGVALMATMAPASAWQTWIGVTVLVAGIAAVLVAAQRFGLLRLLEALARQIMARWPSAASLMGIDAATTALYRRHGPMLQASALHLLAWVLGTAESWSVLWAVGLDVDLRQAFVIEALGMAARSAGFAVPGALVVQETGFALAAVAVGLPDAAGLSLSLIKRVRELVVGLVGMLLWRTEPRPASRAA